MGKGVEGRELGIEGRVGLGPLLRDFLPLFVTFLIPQLSPLRMLKIASTPKAAGDVAALYPVSGTHRRGDLPGSRLGGLFLFLGASEKWTKSNNARRDHSYFLSTSPPKA